MTLIGRMATQTLGYRRRQDEDYWEGPVYDPPESGAAIPFACVYEPGYTDRGRDAAATQNGRVLTTTEFATGDLIVTPTGAQEVTQVNPLYRFDGSIDFYEVYL